ncbi:MAG TPA: ABC transporter permease subunit, partial [Candidatus Kapabacteria bacterium]|nr:ABC transporter permease subunit [Candidatus Kapabacteria bacterium]
VSAAFFVAGAILTESTLSFLGFGVPATIVTWGSVLNEARGATYAWWLAIFPGFAIFLTVLSYNLIGEGLRDALDPRLRD